MAKTQARHDSLCGQHRRLREWSRRELLRAGGLSLFGLSAADLLAGRATGQPVSAAELASQQGHRFGRAKACILLFMWGGPAHQDTWDMKPDAPAEIRGEFQSIGTNVPGVRICEHFPQLAQRIDRLTIVRSMTHTNVDHTPSTHYLLTGEPPPPINDIRAQWPHMGSVLARLGRGQGPLPPFVSMRPKLENTVPRFVEQSQGQFAGWLGPIHDPMTIDADPSRDDYRVGDFQLQPELSVGRLAERRELREQLNQRLDASALMFETQAAHMRRAFELLTSASAGDQRDAFNLNRESDELRDRYGRNPHGQSVLQARRLIERGVPLVTVFWPNDGIKNVSVYWDTHSRNFVDLKERLMPPADQAFSALLDDLQQRGMLDDTLVVWTGEFGRTPKVGQRNSDAGAGRDGRDHWPGCFTSVLAGGGVRGGFVYGKSDRHAAYPSENPVQPRDLIATIYHLLGVPAGLSLLDTAERPHYVRPGTAIMDLIA